MSSKNIFLVLGLSLILAILISSDVSARELTEDTNTKHEEDNHTNGLEESKYGGGYNGGYNGGGGYNRGGPGGGYNRGGGYHRGGGGHGGCHYGCCGGGGGRGYYGGGGCRCCATANEAAQYKQSNPH